MTNETLEQKVYTIETPISTFDYGKGIVAKNGPNSLGMYLEGRNAYVDTFLINYMIRGNGNYSNIRNILEEENSHIQPELKERIATILSSFAEEEEDKQKYQKFTRDIYAVASELTKLDPNIGKVYEKFSKEWYTDKNKVISGSYIRENYRVELSCKQHAQIAFENGIKDQKDILGGFHYAVPIVDGVPTLLVYDSSKRFGNVPNYKDMEKYFCEGKIQSGMEILKNNQIKK